MKFKIAKVLVASMLVASMAFPAFASEKYTVPVKLMHAYEQGKVSMANASLKDTANVVVDNGTTEVTLYLKPLEFGGVSENINKLFVFDGTDKKEASKMSTGTKPYDIKTTFKVASVKPEVLEVAFWVNAMDKLKGGPEGSGEQKAKLNLDWANAKMLEESSQAKPSVTPSQTNGILVMVKGSKVNFSKAPINQKGSVVVPFRETFNALGAEITWNQKTRTAVAKKDGVTLELTLNQKVALKEKDGVKQKVTLQAPAQMINNSIYIPLRFVGEGFGNSVVYHKAGNGGTVTID